MPIRLARLSELGPISKICAASFYDEELNDYMFPHRKQYPDDYVRVWKEMVVKNWWDYNKIWVVNYEEAPAEKSGELITGVAEWGKGGKGSDRLWGVVRWWDPRRLVHPLVSFWYAVRRVLVTNRSVVVATSSDPNPLTKWNFPSRLEPYAERFFSARPDRWELSTLAVHPDHQRRGVGQGLVAWGLDKAKADGLPAVVVAAQGTEPFYQTCGFAVEVGSVSKVELDDHVEDDGNKPEKRIDEKNPLKARGIQGGAVLWTE